MDVKALLCDAQNHQSGGSPQSRPARMTSVKGDESG